MIGSTLAINEAVREGLASFARPTPMTAAAWADENFYLSAESSYIEGSWETLPFQRPILNAMGNDDIRVVNLIKSARVGYTKMLLAAIGYQLEHKKRNQMLWQPTDGAAGDFMKSHVEPMLRDVPVVRSLSPWIEKKHRDNTKEHKRFSNQRQLFIKGGTAAKNYREKSVDVVYYDELSSFDPDIEKEGSPTFLGDKRVEGSVFRKSIRGSTPKVSGECLIEAAVDEADELFRRHVPCPECGEFQVLQFGGPDADFGLKWDRKNGSIKNVRYQCEYCKKCFGNEALPALDAAGEYRSGRRSDNGEYFPSLTTRDGLHFFDEESGQPAETPENVAFHVWTIYSPFSTWLQIIRDFYKAKGDQTRLKTFVNTTKGETWEEEGKSSVGWEILFSRREIYSVPDDVIYITAGVDVQDDRFEYEVVGWGADEQSWSLDYVVLMGNPAHPVLWQILAEKLRDQWRRDDGTILTIDTGGIDSGGHFTDEAYRFSRDNGELWFFPVKGSSTMGKPIATVPRKRNAKRVYLVEVGTDNAKDLHYQRLSLLPQADGTCPPGYCHFPQMEAYDESYFRQLTAEVKRARVVQGRTVRRWELPSGRQNEALDCRVYALAALRAAQQRKGLDLKALVPKTTTQQKPKAPSKSGGQWINKGPGKSWL